MRTFIEAVLTQLKTVPGNKYAKAWNDQLNLEEKQTGAEFLMPSTLVEFVNPQEVKQLGDNVQLYDPLIVRIHILHWQIDSGDGNMEQNLDAWDFAQEVFKKMQKFEPDGAVAFVRSSEERDYGHKGVYHLIQDYKTNYIDSTNQVSTDGVTITGGTVVPVINASYDPPPFQKPL